MKPDRKMPTVLAAMTPFPYFISATATLAEAEKLMEDHGIHHLPVKIDGNIESIISHRDIQRARLIGHHTRPEEDLQVGDVCATRAYFADIHDPLDEILQVMADKHIGAVLVLKGGSLTGIMTYTDVCRGFAKQLRELHPPAPSGNDAA